MEPEKATRLGIAFPPTLKGILTILIGIGKKFAEDVIIR
jgi:hypothetical protein